MRPPIVLDQQHDAGAVDLRRSGVLDRGRGFLARQQDRDPGAFAEFARHLDRSAGLRREAMNLRQSQPGALADRLGGEERIEDLAENVGRDAGAAVSTAMATYSPALISRSMSLRADIVMTPPVMASRALMTRLTSAVSNSATSTMTGQTPGATSNCSVTALPTPVLSTSRTA